MPKSLQKVQKHIAKKKGKTTHLHANGRDARIILRASARDQKVNKTASLREHANQPFLDRLRYIQVTLFGDEEADAEKPTVPQSMEETRAIIEGFLGRYDEELAQIRKARRPGRPTSSRGDLLERVTKAERKEYESGFWVPDLADEKNLEALRKWNGTWVGLNIVKFVRVDSEGLAKPSKWPPGGNS